MREALKWLDTQILCLCVKTVILWLTEPIPAHHHQLSARVPQTPAVHILVPCYLFKLIGLHEIGNMIPSFSLMCIGGKESSQSAYSFILLSYLLLITSCQNWPNFSFLFWIVWVLWRVWPVGCVYEVRIYFGWLGLDQLTLVWATSVS